MVVKPKVIVVIPVYNQERFIRQCLNSVINQSYSNYEIWAIDDGSTDKSMSILMEYKNQLKIFSKNNGGTSSVWNYTLNQIDTNYVIGLDSDDEFMYHTIEKTINFAIDNPYIDLIYSDYEFIDADSITFKEVINPEPYKPLNQLIDLHDRLGQPDNFVPFGHVRLYKTNMLREIGGYNENYLYAEDYELLLRIAEQKYNLARVPEILYRYRWHDTNKGILTRKEQIQEVREAVFQFKKRNQL